MAAPGIEGTVDSAALIVGDWSELWFDYSSTSYPLGNVPEGTIEIGNEYYKHQGTQLPRRIDAVFLISSSMKFTGNLEEVHWNNVAFALGQDPSTYGSGSGSEYLQIGANQTPKYFTFCGRRYRPSDNKMMEFKIWKGMIASTFSLAGGDEAVSVPIEIEGLDDQAGAFGGSSSSPLGYLYVPQKSA